MNNKDEQKFRLLDKLSADIESSMQITESELSELDKELDVLKKTAYVDVVDKVYPGVTIKLVGYARSIRDEWGKTNFKIKGTEIIAVEENVEIVDL